MNKIIDFGALEKPIKQVEDILAAYGQEEKDLIIKHVMQRHVKQIAKQRQQEAANEIIGGMNIKDLWKQMRKNDEGEV